MCNKVFPHMPVVFLNISLDQNLQLSQRTWWLLSRKWKMEKLLVLVTFQLKFWRCWGPVVQNSTILFNQIIGENKSHTPTISTIVLIWNGKGDSGNCSTYQPIWLLSHLIVFKWMLDSLLRSIVSVIRSVQLCQECSIITVIHAICLLIERHGERNKIKHMIFLNLEVHSVECLTTLSNELFGAMEFQKCVLAGSNFCTTKSSVGFWCSAGISQPFNITVGVHQGLGLSPLLFILCIDITTPDLQLLTTLDAFLWRWCGTCLLITRLVLQYHMQRLWRINWLRLEYAWICRRWISRM